MTLFPLLALTLAAPAAHAGDPQTHIDAGLYTDFPTSVGLRATVELPSRVRFSLGGGLFPDPYLASIQGVATNAGWYSESLATLIDRALSRARVVQPRIGYRPWEQRGFWFATGFQRVFAVGAEAESVEVATAMEQTNSDQDYFLESRLDMLTIEAGWEWCIQERLTVRTSLGGAFTVGAQTEARPVTGDDAPFERVREVGRTALETYLNDTYTRYIHTPTVGVELGYRFR